MRLLTKLVAWWALERSVEMSFRKKCGRETCCCLCSCKLYGKKHTHTERFNEELQSFLLDNSGLEKILNEQCVCRACEASMKECMKKRDNGEVFKPRWQVQIDLCCVPSCTAMASIHKHPFSWTDICSSIENESIYSDSLQKPLCSTHYQLVYRFVNASKVDTMVCKICGNKRRHKYGSSASAKEFVLCPNPLFVESFLHNTIGLETHINNGDLLCFNCYKYVNSILNSEECTLSNETILEELNMKEVQYMKLILEFVPSDTESKLQLALLRTALHVCGIVKSDQAFLFPDVYRTFLEFLPSDIGEQVTTKSRVLTFLGNEFGQLLTSFCCNNRIGTIFHRTKANLHVLLSNAVGKRFTEKVNQPNSNTKLNESVQIVVRHMLHEKPDLSRALILDVNSFIDEVRTIAPELWDHVTVLTQSVNERKGRKAATSCDTHASHLKRVRRAYLLSLILFITNSECNFPFHVLLADAVEASGGSTELITILNRLGIVASIDTLKRVILSVSQDRVSQGIQTLLVPDVFTVASVDNVDFLQSHAAVYSGSQHRSCHFTSIQLVQPLPVTSQSIPPQSVPHHDSSSSPSSRRRLFDISNQSIRAPLLSTNPTRKQCTLLGCKRPERHSPICSPQSSTRSPQCKKARARTFPESNKMTGRTDSEVMITLEKPASSRNRRSAISGVTFTSFLENSSEKQVAEKIKKLLFNYNFLKEACSSSNNRVVDAKTFSGMSSFSSMPQSQPSNIVYLPIVDMHADTTEAMVAVVSKLYKEYGIGVTSEHLVVVGDQKTYAHLQEVKNAYGSDLNWLIPFIGDWHLLHNFHSVLMKIYYEAGLKDLAQCSGFRGETIKSLKNCTNFNRTHAFFLQSMEAFYRHFLQEFSSSCKEDYNDLLSSACARITECDKNCHQQDSNDPLKAFLDRFDSENPEFFERFSEWLAFRASADSNWKFWVNFVFRDAFSYFSLFYSIRNGIWDLRLYAIKQIGPLFAAFDRPHYQKLIPCHLHEVLLMPQEIVAHFEKGAFVCNVSGNSFHSVALDEAHEMLVNKDLKTTVVRPTKEYIDRIIHYYPVRAQALKTLKQQVLLDGLEHTKVSIFDTSPHAVKVEENVKAMMTKLKAVYLLTAGTTNPLQSLSGQVAKSEEEKDLLFFWGIGQKQFESRIKYFQLREPSAQVPQRKVKLLTYLASKPTKKKIKMIEREKKLVNKCVRLSLAWNSKVDRDHQQKGGQYLELPRAISDPHGRPNKGAKSYAAKWLEKRYKNVITSHLPSGWIPEVVVLEGMFLINTSPLSTHSSMMEYSVFLFRRFVCPHFIVGSSEVHLVFDNPGKQLNFPKLLERQRRDTVCSLSPDHQHIFFTDSCTPPSNWREVLSCRECKRNLVLFLGNFFKHATGGMLRGQQKVVLAGCFHGDAENEAWAVTTTSKESIINLKSDAEEADTRVWLHALRSRGTRKLVCSPDTDVFHIGLPLIDSSVHVIVQLNTYTSLEYKYLDMDQLSAALTGDPDLAAIPAEARPKFMQSLFVCTGSDFTSFFSGLGKATFMCFAYQHNTFINANSEQFPGSLVHTTADTKEKGFLAFIRLVGTAYYSKHRTCFPFESPRAFLNSFGSGIDSRMQHKAWLECICNAIWERTEFEDELPPSVEALWRHWLRTCWVSDYWSKAIENCCNVLDVTCFGWKVNDGSLEIDWEDQSNIAKVRDRVKLLLRGCSCKKGCDTRRCSCLKDGKKCGPGCRCCNCQNSPAVHDAETHDIEEEEEEDNEASRQTCQNVMVIDEEDRYSTDQESDMNSLATDDSDIESV